MTKAQLDLVLSNFSDQSLPDDEKWKCIKYIYIENPIADVQLLLKRNGIKYIDNSEIGPGFYIIDAPSSEYGIQKSDDRTVTFVALSAIDKITLINSD